MSTVTYLVHAVIHRMKTPWWAGGSVVTGMLYQASPVHIRLLTPCCMHCCDTDAASASLLHAWLGVVHSACVLHTRLRLPFTPPAFAGQAAPVPLWTGNGWGAISSIACTWSLMALSASWMLRPAIMTHTPTPPCCDADTQQCKGSSSWLHCNVQQ